MANFVNRNLEIDYIALANETISNTGTIDVNSELYINAIAQYNTGSSTTRLEVPEGFCGYIDPNTGVFRVDEIDEESEEVDGDNQCDPKPYTPYPADKCLSLGLPGSVDYSNGNCGDEDGDNVCTGVEWFAPIREWQNSTDIIQNNVCNGGPGINSNSSILGASNIGGINSTGDCSGGSDSDLPSVVFAEAERIMNQGIVSLWWLAKCGIKYVIGGGRNKLIVYDIWYTVMDFSYSPINDLGDIRDLLDGGINYFPGGVIVTVLYNKNLDQIVGEGTYIKTYENLTGIGGAGSAVTGTRVSNGSSSDDLLNNIAAACENYQASHPGESIATFTFSGGDQIIFKISNTGDVWGGGTLIKGGSRTSFSANDDFRWRAIGGRDGNLSPVPGVSKISANPVATGVPDMPLLEDGTAYKWRTANGKTVYEWNNVQVYAIRVVNNLKHTKGISGDMISARGVVTSWIRSS